MTHNNYTIHGTVRDLLGAGVPGIRVAVDTNDPNFSQLDPLVFSGVSGADGSYTISFTQDMMDEMFTNNSGFYIYSPINVRFSLIHEGDIVVSTLDRTISSDDICYGEQQDFEVDLPQEDCCCPPSADSCTDYSVFGRIRGEDRSPAAEVHVTVWRKNFRNDDILTSGMTDIWGRYDIAYLEPEVCDPAGPEFEIYVTAADSPTPLPALGSSRVVYDPKRRQQLDFGLGCGDFSTNDYDEIKFAILPFMDGTDPEQIAEDGVMPHDVAFLSQRSGLDEARVEQFFVAMVLNANWKSVAQSLPDFDHVPPQAFYAYVRQRSVRVLEELGRVEREDLLADLNAAIANDQIEAIAPLGSETPAARLEEVVDLLIAQLYVDPLDDLEDPVAFVLSLGTFTGTDPRADKQNFLDAYRNRPGTDAEFWAEYKIQNPTPSPINVPMLRMHIRLLAAVGNHRPLFSHLLANEPLATPGNLRLLARWGPTEWKTAISGVALPEPFPGGSDTEKRDNFALALTRSFEHSFPEVAILDALTASSNCATPTVCTDAVKIAQVCPCAILDLVLGYPEFSLRDSIIDDFFAGTGENPAVLAALKVVQRLYALVPDFEAASKIRAFVDEGFESAQQLASLGQSEFLRRFSGVLGNQHSAMVAFHRAQLLDTTVASIVSAASSSLNPGIAGTGTPQVLESSGTPRTAAAGPTLEQLFGSFDHCSCAHCSSVLSPAAYLLDLLHYISDRGVEVLGCDCTTASADARRPDICTTELTCANTHTPVPHIDLVNELLEERVLWANDVVDSVANAARQTTWKAEQLLAHPEHLDARAYEALRSIASRQSGTAGREYLSAVRPWVLPFDLFLEEARGYTKQLGAPITRLLELLTPSGSQSARIVRERLGISSRVQSLLVDDDPPSTTLTGRHLARSMAWMGDPDGPNFTADLGRFEAPRVFLEATGLELYDALEVLDTYWAGRIDTDQSKVILTYADDKACALSEATFETEGGDDGNWPKRLGRVHRITRLWRALQRTGDQTLKFSLTELDETIQRLSPAIPGLGISDGFLAELATLSDLRGRFPQVPLYEMLSWWGDVEARPDKTIYVDNVLVPVETAYQRMFLNEADDIDTVLVADFRLRLEFDGTYDLEGVHASKVLYDPAATAHPYLPIIASAFGATASELVEVINQTVLETYAGNGLAKLNLRNISLIHMRLSIARALGISAAELFAWEEHCGVSLTSGAAASGLLSEFFAAYDRLQELGLSLAELDFVLDGVLDPSEAFTLSEAGQHRLVLEARALVGDIRANTPSSIADIPGPLSAVEKFSEQLDELAPDGSVLATTIDKEKLRVVVAGDLASAPAGFDTEAHWKNYVDLVLDVELPELFRSTNPSGGGASLYSDHLGLDLSVQPSPDARAAILVAEIFSYQRTQAISEGIAQLLADGLKLDSAQSLAYLTSFRGASVFDSFIQFPGQTQPELREIEQLLAITDDIEFLAAMALAATPPHSALVQLLQDALPGALLIQRLDLAGSTLAWMRAVPDFVTIPPDIDHATGLNLAQPESFGQSTQTLADILRLQDFQRVGELIFEEPVVWLDLLGDSLRPAKVDGLVIDATDIGILAEASSWDSLQLTALIGVGGILPLTYGELRAFTRLQQLAEAMHLQASVKAPFADMAGWIADNGSGFDVSEVSAEQARAIKLHTKSRYDDTQWAKVIQPLRDDLREQQRDALRAYVEDYYDYHSDLGYRLPDWLLIDIEMSACAPTSRIKSAVGAIQLLVQRWHLGLEHTTWANPAVQSDSQVQEWLWRGRYRVWEAQRKVYLYPENWLDGGLRDDKSELYAEFEDRILGAELNDGNVEKALMHYLRGLDEIARLEVNGMYHELEYAEDENTIVRDVLHLFARSRGKSGSNYYRTREGGTSGEGWSAWVKLPFEIEAKDVLPVIFNRRLMVIWPRLEQRAEEIELSELDEDDPQDPVRFNRVTLAWSELHHGEWSEPKETESYLDQRIFDEVPQDDDNIRLTSAFVDGKLRIRPRSVTQPGFDHPGSSLFNGGYFDFGGCDGSAKAVSEPFRVRTSAYLPNGRTRLQTIECTAERVQSPGLFPFDQSWGLTKLFKLDSGDEFDFEVVFERAEDSAERRVDKALVFQDSQSTLVLSRSLYRSGENPYSIENLAEADTLGFLSPQKQREASQIPVAGAPRNDRFIADKYTSEAHYHPYVCLMTQQVERHGPQGLYRPDSEAVSDDVKSLARQSNRYDLFGTSDPRYRSYTAGMKAPYAIERFEFADGQPYSVYNWEVFYHIPIFIAEQLAANHRYADSLKWFHYVFDPTDTDIGTSPNKADYWRFGPFKNRSTSLQRLLEMLAAGNVGDSSLHDDFIGLKRSFGFAQDNPFNPFGVARLRITPFQLSAVMKYLDTIIAWGDSLFRQETIESVAEATQLYVIAQHLLGDRPTLLPARTPADVSVCTMGDRKSLGDALYGIEDRLPAGGRSHWNNYGTSIRPVFGTQHSVPGEVKCGQDPADVPPVTVTYGGPLAHAPSGIDRVGLHKIASPRPMEFRSVPAANGSGDTLLFCIPSNDKLLSYWDEVDDRLFKIRHCLNLAGQKRNIRLFEPPIDPGALISALAGGASLSEALAELNTPPPHYRFMTHLRVAKDFAAELESLGSDLLSTLERRDSEHLAALRAEHELRLLDRTEEILKSRIEEAVESRKALVEARKMAVDRQKFYGNRNPLLASESAQIDLINSSANLHKASAGLSIAASVAALVPDFNFGGSGFAGTPVVEVMWGGSNLSRSFSNVASSLSAFAAAKSATAQTTGIEASHARRSEDWDHQAEQASLEIERIDADMVTASVRIEVAQRELDRHVQQRKNAQEVKTFLETKFTNVELFDWMARQLSRVFYQSYRLAFDLAKRAELCFKAEIPGTERDFITFGAWDDRRKGMLSGQRLTAQLTELEYAYYAGNKREFELTKRFSLNELDPMALVELQKSGSCHFSIHEAHYDLDFPGHIRRRIKSVQVTVPCIAGTFDDVNATLSLVASAKRFVADSDPAKLIPDAFGGSTRIATSHGQEDAGVFEARLDDPRYLPFENKGAVSSWHLQLPEKHRKFDYQSIADVVLTIRYFAQDGGDLYRSEVEDDLVTTGLATPLPQGDTDRAWPPESPGDTKLLLKGLSVRAHYPHVWQRFQAVAVGDEASLQLDEVGRMLGIKSDSDMVTTHILLSYEDGAVPGSGQIRVSENDVALGDLPWRPLTAVQGFTGVMRGPADAPQAIPLPSDEEVRWNIGLDANARSKKLHDIVVLVQHTPVTHS